MTGQLEYFCGVVGNLDPMPLLSDNPVYALSVRS